MTGTTDSLNLKTVGTMLMGLVNVLQDAKGANGTERQAAICCLFQALVSAHRGKSSLRKSVWEFMEFGESVDKAGSHDFPQFRGAKDFVKHEVKGYTAD